MKALVDLSVETLEKIEQKRVIDWYIHIDDGRVKLQAFFDDGSTKDDAWVGSKLYLNAELKDRERD